MLVSHNLRLPDSRAHVLNHLIAVLLTFIPLFPLYPAIQEAKYI